MTNKIKFMHIVDLFYKRMNIFLNFFFLILICFSFFVVYPCYSAGVGFFLYTVIDAHSGEDLSNQGVAVYARKSGTYDWTYVGIYKKGYGNKGNINIAYGTTHRSRDDHLIFSEENAVPLLDLKFICDGYKTLIVKNRSNYIHSSNNVFPLHR